MHVRQGFGSKLAACTLVGRNKFVLVPDFEGRIRGLGRRGGQFIDTIDVALEFAPDGSHAVRHGLRLTLDHDFHTSIM